MQSQTNHKRYVIDVSKSWHVAWWAVELGVSEEALLDAISLVGNEADAVEAHLGIRRAPEQHHSPRRARRAPPAVHRAGDA